MSEYLNLEHITEHPTYMIKKTVVICALSHCPVGIDIESIIEYDDSLANYTMNAQELQLINAAEHPNVAFTCLWTMKEAVLKWKGCGIISKCFMRHICHFLHKKVVSQAL